MSQSPGSVGEAIALRLFKNKQISFKYFENCFRVKIASVNIQSLFL
jgi:hypothetical protein